METAQIKFTTSYRWYLQHLLRSLSRGGDRCSFMSPRFCSSKSGARLLLCHSL